MDRVSNAADRLRKIGEAINQHGAPTAILFPAADLLESVYRKHAAYDCTCTMVQADDVCTAALALAAAVLHNSAPLKHF